MANEKTVLISDFRTVSYLATVGCKIIDTQKEGQRVNFKFADTPELRESLRKYKFENPMVPIHDLLRAQANIRSLIFDDPFNSSR